jgi:thiamine kinase-like enzyme
MTLESNQQHRPIADEELVLALEPILSTDHAVPLKIAELNRIASLYASSFPLEELGITFEDGHRLDLIFKNVSPDALSDAAKDAKPSFLMDPLREIYAYQTVLFTSQFGTARCYGSVVDEGKGRYWLFLENAAGDELYTVGEFGAWKQVARWLASFHAHFSDDLKLVPGAADRLIRYDRPYYQRWMERALSFAAASSQHALDALDFLRKLAPCYSQLVDELVSLPVTIIHGEFYASNVIVVSKTPQRVCPVDWEQTGIGPGLVDLAAVISGNWNEEQKRSLAEEYYAALTRGTGSATAPESFFRALDLCRLHLAIQWLGWSPTWSPPSAHRNDWLDEARSAAIRLTGDLVTDA